MRHLRAGLGIWIALLAAAALVPRGRSQEAPAGAAAVEQALERLNVLGTVLMVAAHPDDENTALLAWLARGRHYRAAYLSLTRGEGGQNLIGPEQGDLMGVIRTQELLAARRVDGAEQYFTRAIDFGYSKTAGETLRKWGRRRILGDIVWVIRKLRPDVIVLRFSGTPRDGHGHHQASAILAKEAFDAAADPSRFAEQLRWVKPWRARRVLWNVFSFQRGRFTEGGETAHVEIDVGEFDPVLGFSYAEIAGVSRSMHRSQGFGAPRRKGSVVNTLVTVAGEPARTDLMEGVDTTWNRVAGGRAVGEILSRAIERFEPEAPWKIAPLLVEARRRMAALDDPWVPVKLRELDETLALVAGLWLDVTAASGDVTPGSEVDVTAVALNRSPLEAEWLAFEFGAAGPQEVSAALEYNRPHRIEWKWRVPPEEPYTTPWWLREAKSGAVYQTSDPSMIGTPDTPPVRTGRFTLRIAGERITLERPLVYRWVDRVLGERVRPVAVVPAVAVSFAEPAVVFPTAQSKTVEVEVTANVPEAAGTVRLTGIPKGWNTEAAELPFSIEQAGEKATLRFRLAPGPASGRFPLGAEAVAGERRIRAEVRVIDYEHIPLQTLVLPARTALVRTDARVLARSVGYVMGAGDEVPAALRQLGCDVVLLTADDLAHGDLSRFDVIVTGVRAYNVRADLRANQQRLLEYVRRGGTLVVQYNVRPRRFFTGARDVLGRLGPYPIEIGRGRVSVEEAPVRFLVPDHPVLARPNHITQADFDGWVQERGLYFAAKWDERYTPLFESADPGEAPLRGATLVARYGKGVYIYTGLSLFRQLPAGAPGAYRLLANFVSAGRAARTGE